MRLYFSPRFAKSYAAAPLTVQTTFDKQSLFLLRDIRHPSLHVKKYDKKNDLWQARVNRVWRFYFRLKGETCELHDIKEHPK